jgi:hypothetical protein
MFSLLVSLSFPVFGPLGSFAGIIEGIVILKNFPKYGISQGREIATMSIWTGGVGFVVWTAVVGGFWWWFFTELSKSPY